MAPRCPWRRYRSNLFFFTGAAQQRQFIFCRRGVAASEFSEIFLLFLSKKSVMLEIIILR
jgi:hypothetical protein